MIRPVPVFMYHHINPHKGDMVTVTPRIFEEQMKHLKKKGCRTLSLKELESYIKGDLIPDQRSVVITFDDGWLDNYIYAYPVLKKYRLNAAIFIITDRTGMASENSGNINNVVPTHEESKALIQNGEADKVVLNWDIVSEMTEDGLVEFYSHTLSHRRCSELTEEELRDELGRSKEIMESRLKMPCPYFCWPYGKYNNASLKVAKETGYRAVFTTDHGVVKTGSDPYLIKRINVRDSLPWFKKSIFTYTSPVFSDLYLRIRKK